MILLEKLRYFHIWIPCIDCGLMAKWYENMDMMECDSDECQWKRHKFGVNQRVKVQEQWRQLQNGRTLGKTPTKDNAIL